MKKLIVALSTIFCSILIMVSVYNMIPSRNTYSAPEHTATYIIADYGGKVAVFEDENSEPFMVYDIYTHLLPENDIEILRKGIKVNSIQELQNRLEDLGL